jgi:hypothetical protein
VRTAVAYSRRERRYEPAVMYRFVDSTGYHRSVEFGVGPVTGGYAYWAVDATGGRDDSPLRGSRVEDDWLTKCMADGVAITS